MKINLLMKKGNTDGRSYFVPLYVFFFLLGFTACQSPDSGIKGHTNQSETKLFTTIPSSESGIDFVNELIETVESNYYQYNYSYIGGGVAAADFNNDGLIDLFFTSNTRDNKLYLNKGDFKFEDITAKAGIIKRKGFDAGVAIADVNNDGFVDIYISRGGWQDEDNKFANMLYVNNGDLTFTEKAQEMGLADTNRGINATFFDYDRDNDLDVYVSNSPDITGRVQVLDLIEVQTDPKTIALKGSDRLYRNDGSGHFTDISIKAGIKPDIGFGLNPQVGDLNQDGWLDIYVCNDFNIPDFAYINNQDGTFSEKRNELVKHMSFNSMGSDIVDVNNDGFFDLMTLDMNPEDHVRSKTTMAMTSVNQFNLMVNKNYHYQYMHNMLHINNGNGTFREISQSAGVANTDWSWSILSADFDLDRYNDIYITNGVFRDVMNRDKLNETMQILRKNQRKPTPEDFFNFAKLLPQQKLNNHFFKNNGDLSFLDTSTQWADSSLTFSNGAVYADLDNDGDLDIVANNINDEATVLKNNASGMEGNNYLKVAFKGPDGNKFGIGTTVKVYLINDGVITRQLINSRGFLSSVSNTLHFGLGKTKTINNIEVIWPDGKSEQLSDISVNQILQIEYANAGALLESESQLKSTLFSKIDTKFEHQDPKSNDYQSQILLPHKLSQTGPAIAKADINSDGLEDVFLGGGRNQSGQLLLAQRNGTFKSIKIVDFENDKQKEDVGACFFDADNDGDHDLYVVSGSYEFDRNSELLQDRLYINNGKGNFIKAKDRLPVMLTAGSVVKASDYDQDGDMDLFVGGRVIPGKYPYPPTSYLLLNNQGSFTVSTINLAPELTRIGMVTDAVWSDMDDDGDVDLLVTGEWMGIEVFINEKNALTRSDRYPELARKTGWWNRLFIADIDNNGIKDIVAGNLGLNYKFHASEEKPFHIYTRDFDGNGVEDVVLAKYYNNKQVPVRGKTCMTQQLPQLIRRIPSYNDFASRDLESILGNDLESALHFQAVEFRTGIFFGDSKSEYAFSPLSNEVQQSPVNSILYHDFDRDGHKDLLVAGNNYMSEVETTRSDAGIGSFLSGNGDGTFDYQLNIESGFFANQDVRNMLVLSQNDLELIFIVNNESTHDLFKVNKSFLKNGLVPIKKASKYIELK